jgi:uncharacterized protein
MTTLIDVKHPGAHKIVLDHDVDIPVRDGAKLKANVFRPDAPGKYPVVMTFGPYGKDLHFSQHRLESWETLLRDYPEIFEASSGKWMVFETPDPEVWVPHGYVVIRVDSRGACKSPGKLDVNGPQEFVDFYDAIEWAGVQPWSNGKIGLIGISYYACGQWMVASLRPPHLAAIQPWQGTSDFYRGRTRTGGMFCDGFVHFWWRNNLRKQHGNPKCDLKDMVTGERLTGTASLSDAELKANRSEYIEAVLAHPLDDAHYRSRSGDLSKIDIPALVVANWGGLGLHLRGTITGFMGLASKEKWLKVQSGSYFATFFKPESVALQRRFFDRYLKGSDDGWEKEPRVEVAVRAPGDTVKRVAQGKAWPLEATKWIKIYLDAGRKSLEWSPPAASVSLSYPALGAGATFALAPIDRDLEFAGPIKAKLFVACDKPDMDLFATIQAFDPEGKEATFFAADEPKLPVSQGWLRVTHRKLDRKRTTDWMPWHSHDEYQPLKPGEVYEIELEIWPASVFLPKGSRLTLTLQGKDFARADAAGPLKGSGLFTHNDPVDRPPDRFDGTHAIHTGGARVSYLQLPGL